MGAKNKRPTIKAERKGSSSSSDGGKSVFIGSSAPEGGKKKIIISPADERDEDELSLSRTNRPLLALLALTPASIYIALDGARSRSSDLLFCSSVRGFC